MCKTRFFWQFLQTESFCIRSMLRASLEEKKMNRSLHTVWTVHAGELKLLNRVSSLGTASCYLDVDATGKTVLVANYATGSVASLPVHWRRNTRSRRDVRSAQGTAVWTRHVRMVRMHTVSLSVRTIGSRCLRIWGWIRFSAIVWMQQHPLWCHPHSRLCELRREQDRVT